MSTLGSSMDSAFIVTPGSEFEMTRIDVEEGTSTHAHELALFYWVLECVITKIL